MDKSTLLMPFIDESESFTNGFECGIIWQMITEGDSPNRMLVHVDNKKQIEMICKSFGITCSFSDHDEQWSYLTVQSILL